MASSPTRGREHISGGTSPGHLPSCPKPRAVFPDSISLYAQGSFLEEDGQLGLAEQSHCFSPSHPEGSASAENCAKEPSPSDVVSRVLSMTEIVGLQPSVEAPSSSEGVWAAFHSPIPQWLFLQLKITVGCWKGCGMLPATPPV